jgi:hypothetical protein
LRIKTTTDKITSFWTVGRAVVDKAYAVLAANKAIYDDSWQEIEIIYVKTYIYIHYYAVSSLILNSCFLVQDTHIFPSTIKYIEFTGKKS